VARVNSKGNVRLRRLAVLSLGAVAIAFVTGVCFRLGLSLATTALAYLLAVVLISTFVGAVSSLILAALAAACLNYFFTEPMFSFRVAHVQDVFALIAFVITSLVITNQVRRGHRLADVHRERVQLLNLAHDTIIVRDIHDVIIDWNRGAEKLYGWTKREALGKTAHELLQTEFTTPLTEIKITLLRHAQWKGEITQSKRDGTRVTVSSRWALRRDKTGTPIGTLETNNDITDRKETLRRNEARWRSIFEQAPVGIGIRDPNGRPIAMNPTLQALIGYSLQDMATRTFEEITHPDDLPIHRHHLARVEAGEITRFEKRYLRKTGGAVWVDMTLANFSGTESMPAGRLAVIQDITERKRAEAALRTSEERWRRLFETSSVGITTRGTDRRITAANPAFQQMTGYTEAELRDFGPLDLTHEDDHQITTELVGDLMAGRRQSCAVELRYRHKNGQIIWVALNASYVHATENSAAFFPAIVVDITDRKRAEEALRRSQAELARVTRITTMGQLASSIAHEINQPLAAIVASGSACQRWLSGGKNPVRAAESLNRMISDANRASDVIKRIRSLMQNGTPERRGLDINGVIDDVLALTLAEMQAKHVSVRRQLNDDLPLVHADRVQLQQVVLNLIMNGIEAMGGIDDRRRVLTVTSERGDQGGILVTVQDSGAGLDPGDEQRIFETFFTTKTGGVGMGLSISMSILEAHGGRLWASRALPHGTAFRFTVPANGGAA